MTFVQNQNINNKELQFTPHDLNVLDFSFNRCIINIHTRSRTISDASSSD